MHIFPQILMYERFLITNSIDLTSHHFSNWLGLANCTRDTNTYLEYGIGNKPMNRIKQNTESIINDAHAILWAKKMLTRCG